MSLSVHDTMHSASSQQVKTYNGGDSKGLLLAVLEETKDVIASDDTGLAGEVFQDTHFDRCEQKLLAFGGAKKSNPWESRRSVEGG